MPTDCDGEAEDAALPSGFPGPGTLALCVSSASNRFAVLPETPGATRMVATSTAAAPNARPRLERVDGLAPSISRETRDTNSERSSAMPATGTPSGDA